MVARQIEKMFPVRIRAPVPVFLSTLFLRISPLPREGKRKVACEQALQAPCRARARTPEELAHRLEE